MDACQPLVSGPREPPADLAPPGRMSWLRSNLGPSLCARGGKLTQHAYTARRAGGWGVGGETDNTTTYAAVRRKEKKAAVSSVVPSVFHDSASVLEGTAQYIEVVSLLRILLSAIFSRIGCTYGRIQRLPAAPQKAIIYAVSARCFKKIQHKEINPRNRAQYGRQDKETPQ